MPTVISNTSAEHSHGTGGARIRDSFPAQSPCLSQPAGTGAETPKGNDTAAMGRPFRGYLSHQGDLPYVSNACQKIHLPKHVRHDARQLLASICKAMLRKVAEHACIAIFHICRKTGTAKPGNEIIDAARAGFGRKALPTIAKMTYQHMHVVDYDGSRTNGDRYYNIVFNEKTYGVEISEAVWARCKQSAWYLYTKIYDWDDNYKRRAGRAIDQAFAMVPGYGRRVKQ